MIVSEPQLLVEFENTISVDVADCAKEPIHIPGLVQPHGLMLILSDTDLRICSASQNAESLIGISSTALLDKSVEEILGAEQFSRLKSVVRGDQANRAQPLKFCMPNSSAGRQFDVLIQHVGHQIVFEAEPVLDEKDGNFNMFYQVVREATKRLQSTGSEEELCQVAADEVRRIIGYDRVMVYRFDHEWNGVVVAESQVDGLSVSYLGLHFPASDIPAQARRLYLTNKVRSIPDASYAPVGLSHLSMDTSNPLDMSNCVLRSASPVHLEYLKNMEVQATLTVSLLRGGKLWGLIACHHGQPKMVCAERRLTCSFLSEIFESQLTMREEGDEKAYRVQTASIQVRFLDLFSRASSISGLANDPTSLLDFVDAQGAVIVQGMKSTLFGQTPGESEIPELIDTVRDYLDNGVFGTDSIAKLYPQAEQFAGDASGLMCLEISRERGDYLLWFRPELVRTVHWAGNPEKTVTFENGTGRLHPRKSFELWKNSVTMHSKRWNRFEVDAVTELHFNFKNAAASEEEIRARNQQLQAMSRQAGMAEVATGVLHNVGNVLNSINTAASQASKLIRNSRLSSLRKADELLQSHVNDFAEFVRNDPRGQQLPSYIQQIAKVWQDEKAAILQEMEELQKHVDHVKNVIRVQQTFAKGARVEQELNLADLIEDSLSTVNSAIVRNEINLVRSIDPIPPLYCDSHKIIQVLVNLLSNAVHAVMKTTSSAREIVVRAHAANGNEAIVQVIDNGIGISEANLPRVFQHGFTTKKEGHGFGLHSSCLIAKELGGNLSVESKGEDCGATFTLTLPLKHC